MNNHFAKTLKLLRTKKHLTQSQLGEKLNLSKSQIVNYETARFEPSLDTIIEFAHFFGVSTDLLLGHNTETKDDFLKQTILEVKNTYCQLDEEQRKSFSKQIRGMSKFLNENREFL